MTQGDEVQLVTCRLGGQDFGFNVFQVERVLRYRVPDSLPSAPEFLEGVLAYGENILPVLDLRKRLSLPSPITDDTRIVILELEQGKVGAVVDAVTELLRVAAGRVTPPAPIVRGLAAEYVSGVLRLGERTVILLAAHKLLTSTERLELERAGVETGS